jgi:ATP adenylyltransferase
MILHCTRTERTVPVMKRLWAPWRMKYIHGIDKNDKDCIFCTKPQETDDKNNLILFRSKKSFIILNAFPYINGHLLIAPYMHTADPAALDSEIISDVWTNVVLGKKCLEKTCNPDGFNIGINLGRSAGAGIEQHMHVHIVPRWNGDTNFMAIMSETRVISQSLHDTYDALKSALVDLGVNS